MEIILTVNVQECPNCHMIFGVTDRFEKDRRSDHRTFYCPQGHPASYSQESEVEKLRKQLAATTEQKEQEAREKRHMQTQLFAAKGQLTKVMNRVKNGVCPKCNRTFSDLHAHMKTKHSKVEAVKK